MTGRKKLRSRYATSTGIPSTVAVVLALVGGALQVVNVAVVDVNAEWHAVVSVFLVFLTGVGVSPLTGARFRAALHVPPGIALAVTSVVSAASVAVATVGIPNGVRAVVMTVLTVLAGLGFGGSVPTVPARRSPR